MSSSWVGAAARPRPAGLEPADARRAATAPPALAVWNEPAVLTSPDIHVARRLADLAEAGGVDHPDAVLGAAFAVRAVRLGHVCVDLASIAGTATSDIDPGADLALLPWPDVGGWLDAMAGSGMAAVGDEDPHPLPLRLVGSRLYLDRYWRQERQVAADLADRAARPFADSELDPEGLTDGLQRLFPDSGTGTIPPGAPAPDLQRLAAAAAVIGRVSVVAGGPGTGKTTTVARILALLEAQAATAGGRPLRVALAAPTGKAAARLAEAVHDEAARIDVSDDVRRRLLGLEASTLHRLLGWRPDSASRFRHDRSNRLPHDVVVVDETSMLSLSLMAKLVDAVRPDARLVLVGDPQQLASVEAGAVLGDVVGPAAAGMRMHDATRRRLVALTGAPVPARDPGVAGAIGDGIVVLQRVHRFGGGIARVAAAVAAGDGDAVITLLRAGGDDLRWFDTDQASRVRDDVVRTGAALARAAQDGRGADAVEALSALRVLCAHRQGPAGLEAWNERIERWLAEAVPGYGLGGPWYAGRPLLVTENDYEVQLYNGDTGVVVAGRDGSPVALFERRGALREVAPARLRAVQTLHAMTVHKSQGSQFEEVVVVLPDAGGPSITRELLYTAVTRARQRVTVVGPEAVLRSAVERPIARASGLRQRLWGD
ncbi:exodeoxyribonuclease V subunit alpha [Acidiferrimicrobium sp. IK]|uniref:exodeoxyribonuclease V subunit alpha n=1 Tax=Acidiferrimicrobium sp. IK TaxID=2871700 RepID=UPI0021CB7617|nr:exodeoxyribonuclease V subunit alpha [Acidiferrimicrobium sp. IK]MCU4186035.1 exodeoxyribonuclease V subunit alpha [Acidiferrimicrobium sp. IK]